MLIDALGEFRDQLVECVPALPQQPQGVQVALVSWSYNVDQCRLRLDAGETSRCWRLACFL